MTITSQQVDAWDAEVDAAYEAGRQEGMKQERALWTLTKLGQEIEAQPEQEPLAYAGVKVWVGSQQVVRLLTQTELHYAGEPWLLVELNALKCIATLKEMSA